jgi:tetratricopeptide (TPR) repeat protein
MTAVEAKLKGLAAMITVRSAGRTARLEGSDTKGAVAGKAVMWQQGSHCRWLAVLMVAAAFALMGAPVVARPDQAPTPSPDPACAMGDQLVAQGLLEQAEKQYSGALDGASTTSATPPTTSAKPDCAVTGLRRVAEQRQHAAVLAAQGDAARNGGNPDKARDLYEEALKADRDNAVAAKDLQTLQAQPASRVSKAQSWWTDFVADTLTPLGQLALWLLAAVVVVYLLVLLTKVAARLPWPLRKDPQTRKNLLFVAVVVPLAVLVLVLQLVLVTFLLASLTTTTPWLIVIAVLGILAGMALASWYLRLRIRLQLEVFDEKGTADADAAAYLAWRLRALGSEPPRGIQQTRQTDVTALDATALSILPGGGFFAPLIRLLMASIPGSTWHAVVHLIDSDRVSVSIERHQRSVRMVVADRKELLFPGTKADDTADLGRRGLLTIAAAMILRTLAEHHDELEVGLAGAKRWESIAGQVLAGELSPVTKPQLRHAMLARAVDVDADNFAARLAYLRATQGEASDHDGQRTFAQTMDDMYNKIAGRGRGWEALQLRVLYNRAAAWFNAYLFSRADNKPEASEEWKSAAERSRHLMESLSGPKPLPEWKLTELWRAMKPWAGWLWLGVCATKPSQGANQDPNASAEAKDPMSQLAESWIAEAPPTARLHYYRACTKAEQRDCEGALETLKSAVIDPDLKRWARIDASFAELRDPDRLHHPDHREHSARFYELVGEPGPSRFTALPPFAAHDDALRAAGIHDAHELLRLTSTPWRRARLTRELEVPQLVVRRWRQIAELGAVKGGPSVAQLDLLLAADVDSLTELRRRITDHEASGQLIKRLKEKAVGRAVPPPSEQTLLAWAAAGRKSGAL